MISLDGLMERLLSDKRTVSRIFASDSLVARLMTDTRAFEKITADRGALSELLSSPAAREILEADEKLLDSVISRILSDEELMKKVLSDDRIFRLAMSDDRTISAVVSDPRLLKTVLANDATLEMIEADPALARKLLHSDEVLDLVARDAELCKRLASVEAVAESVLSPRRVRDRVLETPELRHPVAVDARFWRDKGLASRVGFVGEFERLIEALRPYLRRNIADFEGRLGKARRTIKRRHHIAEQILNLITEDDLVLLHPVPLRFPDRHSLWIVINDILIREDYYFLTNEEAPRILDCGAHFGMATYYFKRLYPKARITAFEPLRSLYDIATENVEAAGWEDVEVLPLALSSTKSRKAFYVCQRDSMAGSLTERRRVRGDEVHEVHVDCVRLSTYLDEPVHFLKLDVEGVEDLVLREARAKLGNVHQLFCEYHHGAGLPQDRLYKILKSLDEAGFDVHVGRGPEADFRMSGRSMQQVGDPYSENIWARNRNWCGG